MNTIADGNVETMAKAHFDPTKGERNSAPVPGSCKKFEAFAPKATGTVETNCKSQDAHGYVYIAAPDGVTID